MQEIIHHTAQAFSLADRQWRRACGGHIIYVINRLQIYARPWKLYLHYINISVVC